MAVDAAGLSGEETKAGDLLGRERCDVAFDPAIETRLGGDQRALVAGQRFEDVFPRDARIVGEGGGESLLVVRIGGQLLGAAGDGLAHLLRVLDRAGGLLLQRDGAAVPEVGMAPRHVPQHRRVAAEALAGDALAECHAVTESKTGIVAVGAGDTVVGGQPRFGEEALAEGDALGRERIVARRWDVLRACEGLLQRGEVVSLGMNEGADRDHGGNGRHGREDGRSHDAWRARSLPDLMLQHHQFKNGLAASSTTDTSAETASASLTGVKGGTAAGQACCNFA